jgi:hypothetical protein
MRALQEIATPSIANLTASIEQSAGAVPKVVTGSTPKRRNVNAEGV